MSMTDYSVVVVGTDGSSLAEPTVARAAWLAKHEDADLVIVCAYSRLSLRAEARNIATLGGDPRGGEVLGRAAANEALTRAVSVASGYGATVTAALMIEGEPAEALIDIGFDPTLGARPLRRAMQREVEDQLSEKILHGVRNPGDHVHVDAQDGTFIFTTGPRGEKVSVGVNTAGTIPITPDLAAGAA